MIHFCTEARMFIFPIAVTQSSSINKGFEIPILKYVPLTVLRRNILLIHNIFAKQTVFTS